METSEPGICRVRVAPFAAKMLVIFLGCWAQAPGESLTIATYNVENYGPADRVTEVGFRKDYPKPEAEKRALRSVIRGLNADVLVFQEMGDATYLDELRRDLRAEGLEYAAAVVLSADDTDRHVAVLSKRPLKKVTS